MNKEELKRLEKGKEIIFDIDRAKKRLKSLRICFPKMTLRKG